MCRAIQSIYLSKPYLYWRKNMKNIIVAFPKKNTAMLLRNVLTENGLYVSHICATGASVLRIAADMRSGIIITASMLSDMSAVLLSERLPAGFDVVAITSQGREEYMGNFISLPLPLDRQEFLSTVEILASSDASFTDRNQNEREIISNAKTVLMKMHNMTEMQAHKYLQKQSMKKSKKMVEIAKEIINEIN